MLTPHNFYCPGQERVELYLYFPLRPKQSISACTRGYQVFPGVKERQGIMLTPHNLTCRGQERVELYLYFSLRPVTASVPVQGSIGSFLGVK